MPALSYLYRKNVFIRALSSIASGQPIRLPQARYDSGEMVYGPRFVHFVGLYLLSNNGLFCSDISSIPSIINNVYGARAAISHRLKCTPRLAIDCQYVHRLTRSASARVGYHLDNLLRRMRCDTLEPWPIDLINFDTTTDSMKKFRQQYLHQLDDRLSFDTISSTATIASDRKLYYISAFANNTLPDYVDSNSTFILCASTDSIGSTTDMHLSKHSLIAARTIGLDPYRIPYHRYITRYTNKTMIQLLITRWNNDSEYRRATSIDTIAAVLVDAFAMHGDWQRAIQNNVISRRKT